MNTLTTFITKNFSAFSNNKEVCNGPSLNSQYEVIENEVVSNCNLKGLNISGSLFSLTTFRNVTFESCVFFGSKIENCEFLNCNFVNCTFQFTSILFTHFNATKFDNVIWDLAPIKKSELNFCTLDVKTMHYMKKDHNHLNNCNISDGNQDATNELAFEAELFGKNAA